MLGHRLEDGADLLLQGRQIPLHHSPDFSKVNAEIVVDQDMAHFDDLRPGYVLVGFPKGRGKLAGCFADDLDVVDHPRYGRVRLLQMLNGPASHTVQSA